MLIVKIVYAKTSNFRFYSYWQRISHKNNEKAETFSPFFVFAYSFIDIIHFSCKSRDANHIVLMA